MSKEYMKNLYENTIPDKYIAQVYNYFLVIPTLQKLFFCFYNPDITSNNIPKFFYITVLRENIEKEIEESRKKIEHFREKWLDIEKKIILNTATMLNEQKWYTPKEVAELLQISQQNVRTKCLSGTIPSKNISSGDKRKIYRIHGSDLIIFLKMKS